jgi:hypothetical protein
MPERSTSAALVERMVAGARIPSRAARDDLRRELQAHFEDAGTSVDEVCEAVRRFGAEQAVAESLRRVYRWDYRLVYAAKIAASIAVSLGAALLVQAAANVRVGAAHGRLALAPGFSHAALLSAAVVIALVVAREIVRPPIAWPRVAVGFCAYACVGGLVELTLAAGGAFAIAAMYASLGVLGSTRDGAARWPIVYGSFVALMAATHVPFNVALGPARMLLASAATFAVWASTSALISRADRLFVGLFDSGG